MKIKYRKLFRIWLLTIPSLIFLSCSNKEDILPPNNIVDLSVNQEQINIQVGEKAELEIVAGNDAYKAFALNEDIASVELSGNKLFIDALKQGKTSIIVSDGSAQYISIGIFSYYDAIKIEHIDTDFKLPLGNSKALNIEQGNGNYQVESSNTEIVSASISEELIILTGKKEGKVEITVSDELDITKTIVVEVSTTPPPYNEFELEAIMNDETLCYAFNNSIEENESAYHDLLNTFENGRNLYGWELYGYYYLRIYFAGDKTVGKKDNASLDYYNYPTKLSADDIYFEIIKNDGEKIWAVYSFVQNERVYYGYFIQTINPEL